MKGCRHIVVTKVAATGNQHLLGVTMKKKHFAFLAVVFGMAVTTSAYAHDSVGFSLNIGVPGYYEAPPVYYVPPPVYYPRPTVYYTPAPVYYEQYGSRIYSQYDEPRFRRYHDDDHHGWRGHHRHDDDD